MDERDFKKRMITYVITKCRKCGSQNQYDANEVRCSSYGFFVDTCPHCGTNNVHHAMTVNYVIDTVLNEEGV